jgi:putative aldouronate transport system substrate-binding protein
MEPITTMEGFEKYLRAVKDSDLDGNGAKDSVPFLSYSPKNDYVMFDNTLLYLFTETSPSGNYMDEKGNVTPIYMHPQYKQFLGTLARWHKEGILYPDIFSIKKNQAEDLIINNRVGSFAAWYSDYVRPLEKLKAKVPEAEYEYVMLKTLKGNPYKFRQNIAFSQRAVILNTSKNAEYAVKLFDWMLASPENYYSTKWGIYGEYWDWADKDKGLVKRLKGADNPEKSYNFAYSMMFYGPWDFRGANPGFVDKKYYEAWDYFSKNKDSFVPAPDWFVNYSLKGTPAYSAQQDADTLIQENKVKIILGQGQLDDWDKVIDQYKKLYGTNYVETATKQYSEYKK